MIDTRATGPYLAAVWSLWKSLLCAAVLFGVIGDMDCFAAAAADDCCATEQCSLCAHSVVCVEVAPWFPVAQTAEPLAQARQPEPPTPHLARLTPPPRPLI